MIKTYTNQTIALAGLSQAVYLVKQIARTGSVDRDDMAASIASVFKIDADDVLDVYGGLGGIRTGLKKLETQLAGPDRVDPEQARYASVLIFLERKLIRQPDLLALISKGVTSLTPRALEFGVLDDDVLQGLGDIYQKTLSELRPRVMVAGEQRYLTDSDNANRIRALLLAGARSAVLWRQCGGTRFRLLFCRGRLQRETLKLLQAVES